MEKKNKKWQIIIAMCLFTVLLNIDVTGLIIAIPLMAREFNAPLASLQWVVSAYVLFAAMFQIIGGRLGDIYGYKKIYLISIALFIVSSIFAGISINQSMLISFRAVQGLALGIGYPMSMVLALNAFPKNQQSFATSLIIATMGFSLAFGPSLGGLIVSTIGWRWIFYINAPVGIISFIIANIYCSSYKGEERHKINYKNAALLIFGLFGITVALNQIQVWGFKSIVFWLFLIFGSSILWFLYHLEKKQAFPIVNFKLFRSRNFLFNNILRLIAQSIAVPVMFFIPLYLQNILGISPIESGFILLFLTLIIGLLSPISGKWIDRVGDKMPNLIAMACFFIGSLLFLFVEYTPRVTLLGVALIFIGIATGISFVSTVTGSVTAVAKKDQAVAMGIILTVAWLGCAIGIAITGGILAFASEQYLFNQIAMRNLLLSDQQLQILKDIAHGVASYTSISEHFPDYLIDTAENVSTRAFMFGFRMSIFIWMIISLIGMIFAICLKKHKIPAHKELMPTP